MVTWWKILNLASAHWTLQALTTYDTQPTQLYKRPGPMSHIQSGGMKYLWYCKEGGTTPISLIFALSSMNNISEYPLKI
jgi:hypothetical protein